MKLLTFEVSTLAGRIQRLGALLPDGKVLDLNAAYQTILQQAGEYAYHRLAAAIVPANMRAFIETGARALDAASDLLKNSAHFDGTLGPNAETLVYSSDQFTVKTPLPNPPMLRDFQTFEAHTKKGYALRNEPVPEDWYTIPVYYKGNPHTLIGPDETVIWPRYTQKLDYELELACIVGKAGQNISADKATSYIFGYSILNDFSARDIQKKEMRCRLGPAKGKDFATAMGPWIVTADEVGDPRNLLMEAFINGERWSSGNSGESHWTFEQMLAHVSMDETLLPGDIFGSGTVGGGCGLELNRWIRPGDTVELSIEKLGRLKNPIG